MGFIFGGNTGDTQESLARRRAIIDQLIAGSRSPKTAYEGIASGIGSIIGGLQGRALDKKESAYQQEANDLLSRLWQAKGQSNNVSSSIPTSIRNPGIEETIAQSANKYGVDPATLTAIAKLESNLNPSARNPNSSAAGLFQFISPTAKQYGLDNPLDPAASSDAGARLARDNINGLRIALGRDPNPGEVYLAHQQGLGGARKILENPEAKAIDVVGSDAFNLNGGRPGMTAQQFASLWTNKLDQARAGLSGSTDALMSGVQRARANPSFGQRIAGIMGNSVTDSSADQPIPLEQISDPQQLQNPAMMQQGAGIDQQTLSQLLRNPFTRDFALQLIQKQQLRDPVEEQTRQIQLEKAQLELEQARNPKPKLTDDLQEYEFAKNQGYQGSFQQYMTDMRRAGATNVNVDNGKLTEAQSKDVGFYNRGVAANDAISNVESSLTSLSSNAAGDVPYVGNFLKSDAYQEAEQSAKNFLAVVLRKDSGGAVTPGEMQEYSKIYIPLPGDSAKTLEMKKAARDDVLESLRLGLGTARPVADKVDQKSQIKSKGLKDLSDEDLLKVLGGQ